MLERVGIGGLLNCQIEPVAGVAVRPDVHAGQQVAFLLRDAVQHPVDHGHGLCAGDVGIGTESPILKTLDPAQLRGPLDVLLRPVSADVGEDLGAAAGSGIEPGADGGELGTGDGGLGVKGRGAAALHDAQTGHGGDGGIGPVVVRHIGIGATGKKTAVPDAVFQQTEEDGGGFRTGDQAVRFHQTILIADDISKMVGVIQHIGRRAAVVSHRFGISDGCALACGEIVFRDLMLRAVQNVALRSRDLGVIPNALVGVLVVHAEQSNAAFRAVPGCRRCCSVDCFAIAAVLVQCKSSAVQCMAVLRIDLFNGEIVGIFAVIIAILNTISALSINSGTLIWDITSSPFLNLRSI